MLYFKWIGIALVLCCGIGASVAFVAFERRRFAQACGFLALLRYIRLQIDCFSLPIGKILGSCDRAVLADCGAPVHAPDFPTLLDGTRLYLPEEICRLLTDLAAQLGGSYREEQLRCCDYYMARLAPFCDRLREELPRRTRMAALLPLAFAAILVLLLL
ncbi:MAG: hypothetical protein IJA78_04250 [Clostridia bacterium]|nr:hypothetical protein [Clostridia bacterium]